MVRPDLPVSLTVNDQYDVPVALHNYAKTPQEIQLELSGGRWFSTTGSRKRTVKLAPGAVTVAHFPIKVTRFGNQRLTVTGRTVDFADAAERKIRVLPDGEQIRGSVSGRLDTLTRKIVLPAGAIPDTTRLWLNVYPGVASEVVSGLAGMIRMPHG